jgi:hypothetical protein
MFRPKQRAARVHFVHALLRAADYQDRPELSRLCDWWRQGSAGVCVLVGIGGAGKTALADRFLRLLPGATAEDPGLPKDPALPAPHRLLVYSFYESASPEEFFAHLAAWLDRRPYDESAPYPSYQKLLLKLEATRPLLLVLDGLEKVQEDALGSVFGQIQNASLRDLVGRLAAGLLPRVRALVTSRFALPSLDNDRPPHYVRIDVEQIPAEAAIALLRRRGVHGSDEQLRQVAEQCGRHALIVDLAGAYLAHFAHGDPHTPLDLGTPEQLQADLDRESDPGRRRTLQQEYRFARVAHRYREGFLRTDPAALALLERISLFHLGADASTLTAIFLRKHRFDWSKNAISGRALASLTPEQLAAKLAQLAAMRLIVAGPHGEYTVHPAVRDGFLAGLEPETARLSRVAVRQQLFTALPEPLRKEDAEITRAVLEGRPGSEMPSDPATLDLLEEILYHTLEAGHPEEAVFIYNHRLGAVRNLGRRLGLYERGERICRKILLKAAQADRRGRPWRLLRLLARALWPRFRGKAAGLSVATQVYVLGEWSLYLGELGHLPSSVAAIEQALAVLAASAEQAWWNLPVCILATPVAAPLAPLALAVKPSPSVLPYKDVLTRDFEGNRARALFWMGRLRPALDLLTDLLAKHNQEWSHYQGCTNDRARIRVLRGEVRAVLAERAATGTPTTDDAWLLGRIGRTDEAIRLAEEHLAAVRQGGTRFREYDACHHLALLYIEHGDLERAREYLDQVQSWALAHGVQMTLCRLSWNRARLALAEGGRERLQAAQAAVENGLWIARSCGLSLHHIDLLILRGRLALLRGDAEAALRDARAALTEGVHPSAESGLPVLYAATDQECGYAWGEAAARHLYAEAVLLRAAQALGQAQIAAPPDARVAAVLSEAHAELGKCRDLRQRLLDPACAETVALLERLTRGELTDYPLRPEAPPADAGHLIADDAEPPRWLNDGQHDHEIARYVREGDPFANRIAALAVTELKRTTRLRHLSFASAVAAGDAGTALLAVEALYLHLKNDAHLHYEYERAFDERTGHQVVRTGQLVGEESRGTCIDLVVLFLSSLANIKLWPVYVHIRLGDPALGVVDHALAGCWLQAPPEGRDLFLTSQELTRRLADGDLLVLDCTGFVEGYPDRQHKLSFEEAREEARRLLAVAQLRFALDIRQAWRLLP